MGTKPRRQLKDDAFGRFGICERGSVGNNHGRDLKQTDQCYMKRLPKVHKSDERFMTADGDPGFDPEHNHRVIEKTIVDYERMQARKKKEALDNAAERSMAVAAYLQTINMGGKTSNLEKYFGNKELTRLRGIEIIAKLKGNVMLGTGGRLYKKSES